MNYYKLFGDDCFLKFLLKSILKKKKIIHIETHNSNACIKF